MSTDVHEGYLKYIKSKVNSVVQDMEENNVLPQEPCCHGNADALASAAAVLRQLSSTDNSNSKDINKGHMKCCYDCRNACFLHYVNGPILDDAVFYTGDILYQYKKVEGRYTEVY